MEKLQKSEDITKACKSNVNNLLPTSSNEATDPIKKCEKMYDEDTNPSADASVSMISTASQTSTPPHLQVDENLNISLDVSHRASNLVDKLMKIVDEELEHDCKDVDALACVLLDQTGGRGFNGNVENSSQAKYITLVNYQTSSNVNSHSENDSHTCKVDAPCTHAKASVDSLVPDVDEAWLQKLDSIDESYQNTPVVNEVRSGSSSNEVKNQVLNVTTLQVPRANLAVTVTKPIKKVNSADIVLNSSKLLEVSQKSSLLDAEFYDQKIAPTKIRVLGIPPTKQSHTSKNVSSISSENTRTTPTTKQPLCAVEKPGMHQRRRRKKGYVNCLEPCQPSNKVDSYSKNDLGATQASLKYEASETCLATTQILDNVDTSSEFHQCASVSATIHLGEKDNVLERDIIKASSDDVPDFVNQPISGKTKTAISSDILVAPTKAESSAQTKPLVQNELRENKPDDTDIFNEEPEVFSKLKKPLEKTEKSFELQTTVSEECPDREVADGRENGQFTTSRSSLIDFNSSISQMNADCENGIHSKVKLKKKQIGSLPIPSSYPSLGPGPPAVPHTGRKYVGAHISAAGGIHNVFNNAHAINAKSFAMFMRSQRQWSAKPFLEEHVSSFKKLGKDFSMHLILPHGSYLMNVGSCKPDLLEKSRALLVEELDRCLQLGIPHFNFHPGSCVGGSSRETCCRTIAESINIAHAKVPHVIVVLENMCKQGNTIGGDFNELRLIIEHVQDRSRVGICIDTCHAHNAGYDLATEEGFNLLLEDFERIIGFQFLRGLHINDSKNEAGAHVDRHECIGKGHIGKEGMARVMNCELFNDLPLILETPYTDDAGYAKEIQMLEGMIDDSKEDKPTDSDLILADEKQSSTSKKNSRSKKSVVSKKGRANDQEKTEFDLSSDSPKTEATKNGHGKKRTHAVSTDLARKKRLRSEDASEPDKKAGNEIEPKRKRRGRSSTGN